ncbi:L-threonylcarbamoyladenylate synthase [Roseovarius sp. EL26]|uniref:L-threonylcarbamoyladenylate synthase n=1 Tax=Roseovarius sp. EL26 TaxID=2126672 RepID=UPI000EA319DE|nr:L-threonylcarbamoyladenylate synthase [Roseovarius sp. EL26]
MKLETEILQADHGGYGRACAILVSGGLVSLPTETVYGLGGDARNDRAVARIFEAKGRPQFNPLIVHVPSAEVAKTYVEWSHEAEVLASAFWPGAMTLVLPIRSDAGISPLVSAGLSTLAIRVPAHPVAQELLEQFGGPVAAPSANPSGRISPTTAAHVLAGLNGRIEAVLDGGACDVGLESTIIGLADDAILLRPGGVPAEVIEAALQMKLRHHAEGAQLSAPGQMTSHYAPGAAVRLNAEVRMTGELMIGFGDVDCDLNLSAASDLTEAAANLFHHLHALDAKGATGIAVSPIPEVGLGLAINDRLRRAAAPRD